MFWRSHAVIIGRTQPTRKPHRDRWKNEKAKERSKTWKWNRRIIYLEWVARECLHDLHFNIWRTSNIFLLFTLFLCLTTVTLSKSKPWPVLKKWEAKVVRVDCEHHSCAGLRSFPKVEMHPHRMSRVISNERSCKQHQTFVKSRCDL